MLKTVLPALLILTLFACNRQPYVEQKLSLKKKADACSGIQPGVKLISNFGGERFEFQKCLPAEYADKSLVTERVGDTVVVTFTNLEGANTTYDVTLDIDSYPRYRYINIDGELLVIGAAEPE